VKTTAVIQHISAVTFAVRDMARSIDFYKKLGFELVYGGGRAEFSSLRAGEAFVNLVKCPGGSVADERPLARARFGNPVIVFAASAEPRPSGRGSAEPFASCQSLSRREMHPGGSMRERQNREINMEPRLNDNPTKKRGLR
jgi:catechol 2,3-dioxygenase-like lactoylglutathione lyase family enzyme